MCSSNVSEYALEHTIIKPHGKTDITRSNAHRYITGPREGLGLYYDPQWGYIPMAPSLRRALDLPTMQRLRHLKQLATLDLVFVGATHTRLEHSVGVLYLAEMAFETLCKKSSSLTGTEDIPIEVLTPAKKLALQYAALFHDVGHGPFSHIWDIFSQRHDDEYADLRHDRLTWRLIAEGVGAYHDIPKFLNGEAERAARIGLRDAELLRPENVAAIAIGAPPPSDPSSFFLSQIVSSQFDVDRMDYLARDALHTGVDVGITDIWQILHSYTLYFDPNSKSWQLAIDVDAAEAIEAFLSARDWAYRMIYYHKMNRIAVEMVASALFEVAQLHDPEQLALLTDEALLELFESQGTPFTRDVARRIKSRRVYEPLPHIEGFRDLDNQARRAWKSYPSNGTYSRLMTSLKELGVHLGLFDEERILFDLTQIPLATRQDYTTPYLIDQTTKSVHSLIQALPHLQLIHGEVEFAGEYIDIGERYIDMISRLLIGIPLDFLHRTITEALSCEVKPCGDTIEPEEGIVNRVVEMTYNDKLEPILRHFIEFLDFSDQATIKRLRNRFQVRACEMLSKLVNQIVKEQDTGITSTFPLNI